MQTDLPVVVTGASGFVAKHLICRLLARGYTVRGTLRSPEKADAVRKVIADNAGADTLGRFEIYVADLLHDAGWAAAMKGAGAVMHTASMVYAREPRNPDDVIRPAMEGTARVLRFADEAGIRRVVLTSSIATVGYGWEPEGRDIVVDETRWTDIDGLDGSWSYAEGKSRAEQAAWAFAKEQGLELTTIHPGMILGPALDADASASLEFVEMCLTGKMPALPPVGFCIVDARDVADMHIAAFENQASIGERYLATGPYTSFLDAAAVLAENYPKAKVPRREAPAWIIKAMATFDRSVRQIAADMKCIRRFDGAKGEALMGHAYHSPEEALLSSAESLIEHGVIDEARVL